MNLREEATAMADDLTVLRQALHREPEIGLHLPGTQEKVLAALDGLPIEVTTGRALSSVTAVLRGERVHSAKGREENFEGNGDRPGPVVLLRADMDALPVTEQTDVPFRSRVDGAMHACGHDLHTAMLVGAARLLAAHRARLAGDVVFMFQPGEEGHDGARLMIEEGVLEAAGRPPAAAYALHVSSARWPRGTFVTRSGPLLAASDHLAVTVHGQGGHGSAPHRARDPVPVACEIVTALQTQMTRSLDPFDTAVLTVGHFHAGTRRNIIPEQARFDATIRTFRPDVRQVIADRAPRLCRSIAEGHGLEAEVYYTAEYPVTVTTEQDVAFAGDVVGDVFGADRFQLAERPLTASEDFSRVLERVPGAMVFLGATPAGVAPQTAPDNHSANAAFDDAVLADGAALYAEFAARGLGAVS